MLGPGYFANLRAKEVKQELTEKTDRDSKGNLCFLCLLLFRTIASSTAIYQEQAEVGKQAGAATAGLLRRAFAEYSLLPGVDNFHRLGVATLGRVVHFEDALVLAYQ